MATFVVRKHPVSILITDFTNPDNLTYDLLILNSLTVTNDFSFKDCKKITFM